ncbi:hypothetical protein DPMN_160252 [Dreissena polymorpha]|uniref:Uncharacterized protein n=1 Tax=Dreissena polymorpha TaxID=45954 RepID=A0A9D4EL57_DREPO|nr:hypothetical protein DPMN_160252 [Dreissena polymorpha]
MTPPTAFAKCSALRRRVYQANIVLPSVTFCHWSDATFDCASVISRAEKKLCIIMVQNHIHGGKRTGLIYTLMLELGKSHLATLPSSGSLQYSKK